MSEVCVLLSVMTFNLLNGEATGPGRDWTERRDIAVGLIREVQPDVFGVQECFDYQAQYLADALPECGWFGRGRNADGADEMAAVFYKKAAVALKESGHFWLSETPDTPGTTFPDAHHNRMVTWGSFEHVASGKPFYFFNTHFDHACAEARDASARLLGERARSIGGDNPCVVVGDFNAAGGMSTPWELLTAAGLRDAWLADGVERRPAGTWHGLKGGGDDPKTRIDWVLVSEGVGVEHCEAVTYEERGRLPSDHYPVQARLTLSKE